MIEFATLSGPAGATLLVGVVFLQAIALYVGYAALEWVARPLIETATST